MEDSLRIVDTVTTYEIEYFLTHVQPVSVGLLAMVGIEVKVSGVTFLNTIQKQQMVVKRISSY